MRGRESDVTDVAVADDAAVLLMLLPLTEKRETEGLMQKQSEKN